MNKKILFIPLALFLVMAITFLVQLVRNADGDDPSYLESALVGKPVPMFKLESLEHPGQFYQQDVLLNGQPLLLNVWATWCPSCYQEHQYLNSLASKGVRIVGLNYKDQRDKAVRWLQELGNPYALSLYDNNGQLGLDLGVYGAPETFIIDGQGIVRYRYAGPVDEQVWREQLEPVWKRYQGATP